MKSICIIVLTAVLTQVFCGSAIGIVGTRPPQVLPTGGRIAGVVPKLLVASPVGFVENPIVCKIKPPLMVDNLPKFKCLYPTNQPDGVPFCVYAGDFPGVPLYLNSRIRCVAALITTPGCGTAWIPVSFSCVLGEIDNEETL